MSNTYTFYGPGETRTEKDPTDEDLIQAFLDNDSHLYEALNTIMDTDAADGVLLSGISFGSLTDCIAYISADTDNNSADTDAEMVFEIDGVGGAGTQKGHIGYDQGLDRLVVGYSNNNNLLIDTGGNVAIGNAILAVNATDGFLYIPSCAGEPTGTPTAQTGTVPLVYDTTNDVLYAYNAGWQAIVTGGLF